MTRGSIQILVNIQDSAGQGVDVIFIFDTVMEELHLVDQASILTIDFCLFHHDIVLLCKTRVLMV